MTTMSTLIWYSLSLKPFAAKLGNIRKVSCWLIRKRISTMEDIESDSKTLSQTSAVRECLMRAHCWQKNTNICVRTQQTQTSLLTPKRIYPNKTRNELFVTITILYMWESKTRRRRMRKKKVTKKETEEEISGRGRTCRMWTVEIERERVKLVASEWEGLIIVASLTCGSLSLHWTDLSRYTRHNHFNHCRHTGFDRMQTEMCN